MMEMIVLTIKLKMDDILYETRYSIIPSFHFPMIEVKTHASKKPRVFKRL